MGLLDHKRKMYIPTDGIYDVAYPMSDDEKRRHYKDFMKRRRKERRRMIWQRTKWLLAVAAGIIATIAGLLDIFDHIATGFNLLP